MAQAICRYFETWNPKEAFSNNVLKEYWEELTDGGNLIFCMGKNFAQDDPIIKETWIIKETDRRKDGRNLSGNRKKIPNIKNS